jgi:hypothetical protein
LVIKIVKNITKNAVEDKDNGCKKRF